ncbi:unnamed protein product [Strongylus vulgaris]|uniref:Uncharacterized protein n=1 Tax=Strongylus vulgaris TaxID=40348 RepID=A0A3P7L6R9_STRVU|nr:unnamed protein product [Strongylus vulgaris]
MSKVALPFQQMMKRASRPEQGSDSDSQDVSRLDHPLAKIRHQKRASRKASITHNSRTRISTICMTLIKTNNSFSHLSMRTDQKRSVLALF